MNIKSCASAVVKHASYNYNEISVNLKLDFVFHSRNTFNGVFYNQSKCREKRICFSAFPNEFFCVFVVVAGGSVFVLGRNGRVCHIITVSVYVN